MSIPPRELTVPGANRHNRRLSPEMRPPQTCPLRTDSCCLRSLVLVLMALVSAAVLVFLVLNVSEGEYEDRFNLTTTLTHHVMVNRKGEAFKWLAELCDDFGPRQVGSDSLEKAIDHVLMTLRKDGFDAHTEPVPGLPNWKRMDDSAEILEPRRHKLSILAIDGSPPGFVEAEAIVLERIEQLESENVQGKIVVFNQKWTGYGSTVVYRKSAIKAASRGAVGVLVRSVTPFSLYSAHTGAGARGSRIPAACVTSEEAQMLGRWFKRGKKIVLRMNITSYEMAQPTISRNVIFDIKGSAFPDEIVVLSGHIDSWDVGQGAVDDGGGMAVVRDAMLAIKELAMIDPAFRPKRTIRGIFWTAEEQGLMGAKQYFADHFNRTNEKFVFVSETDQGAFRPLNYQSVVSLMGDKSSQEYLVHILRLINDAGIPLSLQQSNKPGGDIAFFASNGVPAMHYKSDRGDDYYFNFHHTQADYVSIFEEGDLESVASIFAVIAHNIANMRDWNDY